MRFQKILIITLTILTLALLVGHRFGFVWAGGNGYDPHLELSVIDATYDVQVDGFKRGEIVSTGEAEWLTITSGTVTISLDERTDVELVSTQAETIELYVHRGRVVVETDTSVKIRSDFVRSEFIDGQVSFVYYDFLHTASIIPFDTKVNFTIADQTGTSTKPIDILELDPYTATPFSFDPAASSAAEFYEWAL